MQFTQSNEISLYSDELATIDEVKYELQKLSVTFPDIDNNFIIVLTDRLKSNQFTKQRLQDAISYVIDTCRYPRPSIAEIISFDRKVRTYSFSEMCAKCSPQYTSDNFGRIEINGQTRYFEK